jgi:hypothetical protein
MSRIDNLRRSTLNGNVYRRQILQGNPGEKGESGSTGHTGCTGEYGHTGRIVTHTPCKQYRVRNTV